MTEILAPTTTPDAAAPRRSTRLAWLDVLRGFALSGIIFVNIPTMFLLTDYIVDMVVQPTRGVLDMWVQNRFFPIFSFLFGTGFGLMWLSARRRSTNARRALAQRIAVLGVMGVAHQLLQPGEALLPYAVVAAVLLLPSTWLPRWVPLLGGLVLTPVGAVFGGIGLIPGLFLLGFAAAQYGLPQLLERKPWLGALVLVPLVPAAWVSAQWQLADPVNAMFNTAGAVTGLVMATAYAAAVVAAMGIPVVRDLLRRLFSPLGRMALTNYLSATVLMFVISGLRPALGIPVRGEESWHAAMWIALAILAVQWVFSTLWLRWNAQGPLEALWRRLTWMGVGAA